MFGLLGPVPEVDASIFDLDVIEGEPKGFGFLCGLFCRLGFLIFNEVGKIERRLADPFDVDSRVA